MRSGQVITLVPEVVLIFEPALKPLLKFDYHHNSHSLAIQWRWPQRLVGRS
jgi:hypothetical protein